MAEIDTERGALIALVATIATTLGAGGLTKLIDRWLKNRRARLSIDGKLAEKKLDSDKELAEKKLDSDKELAEKKLDSDKAIVNEWVDCEKRCKALEIARETDAQKIKELEAGRASDAQKIKELEAGRASDSATIAKLTTKVTKMEADIRLLMQLAGRARNG